MRRSDPGFGSDPSRSRFGSRCPSHDTSRFKARPRACGNRAVEYAVPLALAADAPAGFTGAAVAWDRNETFQLWTLHAWVWLNNPSGMFAPFNPRVD